MDNIETLQTNVAMAREALAVASARVKTEEDLFEASIVHLREDLLARKQQLAQAEEELKARGVAEYLRTGIKIVSDYVVVKLFKRPLQYDQKAALEWCRTNMPVAIVETVNKDMFEAYPSVKELDFVTAEEDEPRATISKKL